MKILAEEMLLKDVIIKLNLNLEVLEQKRQKVDELTRELELELAGMKALQRLLGVQ